MDYTIFSVRHPDNVLEHTSLIFKPVRLIDFEIIGLQSDDGELVDPNATPYFHIKASAIWNRRVGNGEEHALDIKVSYDNEKLTMLPMRVVTYQFGNDYRTHTLVGLDFSVETIGFIRKIIKRFIEHTSSVGAKDE